MNVQVVDMVELTAFWLTFCRLASAMVQFPFLDEAGIPVMIKTLSIFVLTYAFYPTVSAVVKSDVIAMGENGFWLLTIFYTIIGIVTGLLVKSIMQVFYSAGSIITQQIGFGAVNYFDPQAGQQVGPFEKLIVWTMLIVILTSGAIIPMFKGTILSFGTITFENFSKLSQSPMIFLDMFKSLFVGALLLSAPAIFVNLLIMTVLGVIAKTVPQMNVLMVSFVVNIGLGLLVFASSSSEFFQLAFKTYTDFLGRWFQIMT